VPASPARPDGGWASSRKSAQLDSSAFRLKATLLSAPMPELKEALLQARACLDLNFRLGM
jgi:hypothetical protein